MYRSSSPFVRECRLIFIFWLSSRSDTIVRRTKGRGQTATIIDGLPRPHLRSSLCLSSLSVYRWSSGPIFRGEPACFSASFLTRQVYESGWTKVGGREKKREFVPFISCERLFSVPRGERERERAHSKLVRMWTLGTFRTHLSQSLELFDVFGAARHATIHLMDTCSVKITFNLSDESFCYYPPQI